MDLSGAATDRADGPANERYPHGSALVARRDVRLRDGALIAGVPKPQRGVRAVADLGDRSVAVASWHAPNAAGEGVGVKMQGYRAINAWMCEVAGPAVIGFDSNHWSITSALDLADVPNSSDRWLFENQFFGRQRLHGFRDALLDHLRERPDEYARVLAERPDGPLAVSYVRGRRDAPVADRFDYVFVSNDITVREVVYDYAAAVAAGSDHGSVRARLRIS